MNRPASIARDLVLRLALVFVLGPLIAVPILLVIDNETPKMHIDRAVEAQADAIVGALRGGPEGGVFVSQEALNALPVLKDARFAVYDGLSAVPLLRWPAGTEFHNWDYRRSYDTLRNGPTGPVRILFVLPGVRPAWIDWIAEEITAEMIPLLGVLMGVTLPLAALTVRRSLMPVRRLAAEAAAIEPGTAEARLSEIDTPAELLPLVKAINGALARIDAGFAAQRRFSANIAHELRTPLAVLAASLEDEPSHEQLAEARRKLHGMARLIGQLLTIAELSAKRMRMDEPLDLVRVARETVAAEAPSAIAGGIRIELDSPDEPMPLRGNVAAIATALRNLIDNAVRHAGKGGRVTVTLDRAGPAIEVADTGPGIPLERRSTIFEPFWRDPKSRGTGIGLAIVRQMAELHRAKITLRDNRPTGTIFRIDFGAA